MAEQADFGRILLCHLQGELHRTEPVGETSAQETKEAARGQPSQAYEPGSNHAMLHNEDTSVAAAKRAKEALAEAVERVKEMARARKGI